MKSYDIHVFFDREGNSKASCTLDDARRLASVPLTDAEVDVLARIATRSSCKDAAEKLGAQEEA